MRKSKKNRIENEEQEWFDFESFLLFQIRAHTHTQRERSFAFKIRTKTLDANSELWATSFNYQTYQTHQTHQTQTLLSLGELVELNTTGKNWIELERTAENRTEQNRAELNRTDTQLTTLVVTASATSFIEALTLNWTYKRQHTHTIIPQKYPLEAYLRIERYPHTLISTIDLMAE